MDVLLRKDFHDNKWKLVNSFDILESSIQHPEPFHFIGVYEVKPLEIQPIQTKDNYII